MVDLGPVGPWPFSYVPRTVTEALELWHAAWERDHPGLLGPMGASFYEPDVEPLLAKREPLVRGVTMAEASANLLAATERLKQGFPTKGGYESADIRACDLPRIPEAWMQRPQPPPGPGAATPSAWEQHRKTMRDLKEMRAEVLALRAKLDALPPLPELPPLHVDPLLIGYEKR